MISSIPDPAALTRHYEALRAWVTDPTRSAGRPPGLALVLQRGLPGWLAARAAWEPGNVAGVPARPFPAANARGARLAGVLASMVEGCRQEQRR